MSEPPSSLPPTAPTAAPARAAVEPPRDSDGRRLPGLRDRSVQLLLVLVLGLQAWSWWLLEGYQLADSVEYMERALSFVRSEPMIDSHAIRSFGFSTLLVPFFWVWDRLGIEDMRPLVDVLRAFQIALGLALVVVCARLGARLGGRSTGLAAGFVVGVNPIFLQYTVSPLSGIAAALFVGLGLGALVDAPGARDERTRARGAAPGEARRTLLAGAWLGLAFLMAYQTVIVVLPLAVLVLVRGGRRRLRASLCVLVGPAVAVLAQLALDKAMYGTWGASLGRYLVENGGYHLARVLAELGLRDLAYELYRASNELLQRDTATVDVSAEARQLQPPTWYLANLPRLLVWPVLACAALGLARALRRFGWTVALLLVTLAVNVAALQVKGSKSFRLWLPLLPMIAPLCAWGWSLVRGPDARRAGFLALARRGLAAALLVGAAVLGVDALGDLNTRRFGVYWEAMRIVNAEAERTLPERAAAHAASGGTGEVPRMRASAAYHWAMYLRESPLVESVKLPHNLDQWRLYDEESKAEDYETLETLDWFLLHAPVLHLDPDLTAFFNERFSIAAALYHRDVAPLLGPVFVLDRRTGDPDERTFYAVVPQADVEAWLATYPLAGRRALFRRVMADGHVEELVFLGYQVEPLEGSGFGWITYHWLARTDLRADWTIVDRLTSSDERRAWQNNHRGANGAFPTFAWTAGTLVRESFLLVPAHDPFRPGGYGQYLGGPWRRGDLVPTRLWLEIARFAEDGARTERLLPCAPGTETPLEPDEPGAGDSNGDGWLVSIDGLVQVGGLLLPTHPDARLADDGSPAR